MQVLSGAQTGALTPGERNSAPEAVFAGGPAEDRALVERKHAEREPVRAAAEFVRVAAQEGRA